MSETTKKVLIGLAVTILIFVLAGSGNFRTLLRQREDIHQLEGKIKKQIELNRTIKYEINLTETNPAYIEKIARQKLGLIQPGEIVYKFINKDKGSVTCNNKK